MVLLFLFYSLVYQGIDEEDMPTEEAIKEAVEDMPPLEDEGDSSRMEEVD